MELMQEIDDYLKIHPRVNILIAGSSCSGKTTLANKIFKCLSNKYTVTIISQDDYFKDILYIPKIRKGYLIDSINAFHIDEFKTDVHELLTGNVVKMPRYDIATNTRMSKDKIVKLSRINIFEGLHVISLLDNIDNCLKIYLDTNIDICLKRRIDRDSVKYGIPGEIIKSNWDQCIIPMFKLYILPQKEYADIIINNEDGDINAVKRDI